MVNLESVQLQFYIQFASLTFLYYDYCLTFSMEVKYIWSRRFRFSTLLYFCCRYGLVANVIYVLSFANRMKVSCEVGYKISGSLAVLGRAAILAVWTARTWAIFSKSRLVLGFFASIGLACVILDIMHIPSVTCGGSKRTTGDILCYQSVVMLAMPSS